MCRNLASGRHSESACNIPRIAVVHGADEPRIVEPPDTDEKVAEAGAYRIEVVGGSVTIRVPLMGPLKEGGGMLALRAATRAAT